MFTMLVRALLLCTLAVKAGDYIKTRAAATVIVDCAGKLDVKYKDEAYAMFDYPGGAQAWGCAGGSEPDSSFTFHSQVDGEYMDYISKLELWYHGDKKSLSPDDDVEIDTRTKTTKHTIDKVCVHFSQQSTPYCAGLSYADVEGSCTFDFEGGDTLKAVELHRNGNDYAATHKRFGGLQFTVARGPGEKSYSCGHIQGGNHFDAMESTIIGKQLVGVFGGVKNNQILQFGMLVAPPTCKTLSQTITKIECENPIDGDPTTCQASWTPAEGGKAKYYFLCDHCSSKVEDVDQTCDVKFTREALHAVTTQSAEMDSMEKSHTTEIGGGITLNFKDVFGTEGQTSEAVTVSYATSWEKSKSLTSQTETDISVECNINQPEGTASIFRGDVTVGQMTAGVRITVEVVNTCEGSGPTEKIVDGQVIMKNVGLTGLVADCKGSDYNCNASEQCASYTKCEECHLDHNCKHTASGCVPTESSEAAIQCPIEWCKWGIKDTYICCDGNCPKCGGPGCNSDNGCCYGHIENSGVMCLNAASTRCIIPHSTGIIGHFTPVVKDDYGYRTRASSTITVGCEGVPSLYDGMSIPMMRYGYNDQHWACAGGSISESAFSLYRRANDDGVEYWDYVKRIEMWEHKSRRRLEEGDSPDTRSHGDVSYTIDKVCVYFAQGGEPQCAGRAYSDPIESCVFDFGPADTLTSLEYTRNGNDYAARHKRFGGLRFNVDRSDKPNFACGHDQDTNHFTAYDDYIEGKQIVGVFGGILYNQLSQMGVLVAEPNCRTISQKITNIECASTNPDDPTQCAAHWESSEGGKFESFFLCDHCNATQADVALTCDVKYQFSALHSISTQSAEVESMTKGKETEMNAGITLNFKDMFTGEGKASEVVKVEYTDSWETSKARTSQSTKTFLTDCGITQRSGTASIFIGSVDVGHMTSQVLITVSEVNSCDVDGEPTETVVDGQVIMYNVGLSGLVGTCDGNDYNCNYEEQCALYNSNCAKCDWDPNCKHTSSGCVPMDSELAEIPCPVEWCKFGLKADSHVCCDGACPQCGGPGCISANGCCYGHIENTGPMCLNAASTRCNIPQSTGVSGQLIPIGDTGCSGLNRQACKAKAHCEFNKSAGACVKEGKRPACGEITRGKYCGGRFDCWWNKKKTTHPKCIELACENATSKKICLGHFKDNGLRCGIVDDKCVDYDPEVCATNVKPLCIANPKCEYDRIMSKCVDLGDVPCVHYTKGRECVNAEPKSAPLRCHFDKLQRKCMDMECAMSRAPKGCVRLGCHWDGSTCSDQAPSTD